jgi:heme-degrading monooxygenase HmoA
MIHEVAHIIVKEGMQAEFERGVAQAAPLFQRAQGCLHFGLQRGVEHPTHYRLLVDWATLEDHTVHFRGSADFQSWRALVGHCFAEAPQVVHTETALAAF